MTLRLSFCRSWQQCKRPQYLLCLTSCIKSTVAQMTIRSSPPQTVFVIINPLASYYLKRQVQKFLSFFHLISFSFYIYEMEHYFSTVLMAFSISLVSDFSSKYYLAFDTYKITHARYFMMALINNTNVANFHMAFQRVNFAFIPVLLIKQKLCKKQLSYTTVANGQISSLYSKSISIMCITSIIVHFYNKFAGFFNISSSSSISTRSAVLCNNRY